MLVLGFAMLDPSDTKGGSTLGLLVIFEFFIVPIFAVLGWLFGCSTAPSPKST
jgi:hypothetical protein